MFRRIFTAATFLSAVAFAGMALCVVRAHFAHDVFRAFRWNPSTRLYTEICVDAVGGGIHADANRTTVLATDNTAAIQALAGPFGTHFTHEGFPPAWTDRPVIWADYFRSTPWNRLNQHGLASCWVLEFRCDWAVFFLCPLPAIWAVKWFASLTHRRRMAARGFPVITSAVGDSAVK
jgi:hypothetical protein